MENRSRPQPSSTSNGRLNGNTEITDFTYAMRRHSMLTWKHKLGKKPWEPTIENQAQLGLVCEHTLRENGHSNGQESPLSFLALSMSHRIIFYDSLMCLVVNEERWWLYKVPSSHFVMC